MKKNKIIILVSVLIIAFLGLVFVYKQSHKQIYTTENRTLSTLDTPLVTKGQTATPLKTSANSVTFTDNIPETISVYDFMTQLQKEGEVNFSEKNYSGMGELITSINGIKNNGTESWIYYVNGKEASVGVSNYKINAGNTVTWKYEKSF